MNAIIDINCPENCLDSTGNVYGTDEYTEDSALCLAAIHAGVITNSGGDVKIMVGGEV